MENLVKHLEHMPRQFNSEMPINTVGFIPVKKEHVTHTFESYNFSFIIEGTGTYVHRGKTLKISAPCVITQWPGEPMNYGPDKNWFEIYLIYSPNVGDTLKERNFFRKEQPVWHISNPDKIVKYLKELKTNLQLYPFSPDRIDHICEGMIMESLLAKSNPPQTKEERTIRAIKSYIRSNFTKKHDFDQLARKHGMSLSTFRRYWLKYTGGPPAKYQSDLQIQEACRLLVETSESIKEIAEMLNFQDPLYLTKKFHKETAMTPTEYRKQHQQFPV